MNRSNFAAIITTFGIFFFFNKNDDCYTYNTSLTRRPEHRQTRRPNQTVLDRRRIPNASYEPSYFYLLP